MFQELAPLAPEEIVERSDKLISAAMKTRSSVMEAAQSEISDPSELHGLLVNTRHATDKLEQALVYGLALQRAAESRHAVAKAEIEEAELAALESVRRSGEYTTAKEKSVEFVRHSVEQRRAARQSEETLAEIKAAVEILRILHRGVDSTRRDIEVRLRAVTLTSSLERG